MTKLQQQLNAARAEADALRPDDRSIDARRSIESLGAACRALGLWDEALGAFERMLRLCEQDGDQAGASEALTWKSNVFYHCGAYGGAIELATRAVSLSPDGLKRNRMSYYLAQPHLMLGDVRRYVALQRQALEGTEVSPEQERRVPWYRCRLARGLLLLGDIEEARRLIVEQVDVFRRLNREFGLPAAQLVHGAAETSVGNFAEAGVALDESLRIYRENRQEGYVVDVLTEQSRLAEARGDRAAAVRLVEEAIAEARKGPRESEGLADSRHLNFALARAASAYREAGDQENAAAAHDEALRLAAATSRGLILRELLDIRGAIPPACQAAAGRPATRR